MITCQHEAWANFKQEALRMWEHHYEEIAQDKEHMKLDPDIERIDSLDQVGKVHIVCARLDGKLIGYHATIVDTLIHYKSILAGIGDMYWIHPQFRKSGVGAQLFAEVESTLKARGIKVLYDITKLYADHGSFLESQGYRPLERRYSKWIGD